MRYVEFIEFLGRLAFIIKLPEHIHREIIQRGKEKDKEKEEVVFAEKLEYLLDVLFAEINVKRKPRENIKDQYECESDYDD